MKKSNISFIIITISILLAEIVLIGGSDMGVGEWIAIIIALIGIAGGIWTQVIQFKKDAQRIDGVNQTANSVKEDTIKIEPSVARIEKNTDTMKDRMLEDIIPGMKIINKIEGGMDTLIKNAEFEEKLRKDVTNAVTDPGIIKSAVDVIYEENAKLNKRVAALNSQNIILQNENNRLRRENSLLKNMVREPSIDFGEELDDGLEP